MITFAGDATMDGLPAPYGRGWFGWYIDWITYAVVALALLLGLLVVLRRGRRDTDRNAYAEAFGSVG